MTDTINQVGAGAPAAWTRTKPTAPGAYWIRGEGEGMLARTALVEVVNFEGELWCNLHMRNTDPEFGYGYTVAQLDEAFEWIGPLVPAAPAVQAEQQPVAWQVRMVGDTDWQSCGRQRYERIAREGWTHVEIRALCVIPPRPPVNHDAALVEALEHARQFIRNGVDLGFIRMPDADAPDPAHETLPKIDAALSTYRAALAGKGGE